MKRVLSVGQRVNFDIQSSSQKSDQLISSLVKLIGISVVMLGVLAPSHIATAAVQPKSSTGGFSSRDSSFGNINVGKSTYSLLSAAIAGSSPSKSSSAISNTVPKSEIVIANQPIPDTYSDSLNVKSSMSKIESSDIYGSRDSSSDAATAKLEFEPQVDPSVVSEVIQPVVLEPSAKPLNVLTTLRSINLIAMEFAQFPSTAKPTVLPTTQNLEKVSSQLIENLESGIEAIATSTGLAPELPSLIAKVYLPETSDYGLSSSFVWPAQGLLSSRFGWRWGRLHQGIDIAAPVGTPIWATATGTVDFAGWNSGGYGNMVDIIHPNGTVSRYAHLSAIYVKQGQTVSQSQVIAAMGNTGASTGPHLHFELRPNGRAAINPMTFLAQVISKG